MRNGAAATIQLQAPMGCAARSKGLATMQLGLTAKHGTRAIRTTCTTDE